MRPGQHPFISVSMDNRQYDVAVVGATGEVGGTLIDILVERGFPLGRLHALASSRSAGNELEKSGLKLRVEDAEAFDFSSVQIAFFSAGGSVSEALVPKAVAEGAIVIDNTSFYRNEDDIPLVVPEVNPDRVADYSKRGIISNPNCSTIQMVVALKPIHAAVGIERINVATYQAVSGAGRSAIGELEEQSCRLLSGDDIEPQVFPAQMAFNVLPQIDSMQDNGYSREEMKMVWETRKILEDPGIGVNPTCVRVPVFYGHSEAVHIETREPIDADRAKELLRGAPGVVLLEGQEGFALPYPTPAIEGSQQDGVFVGRVRSDLSHPHGLDLWVVSDNVRKGGALNSVQIAELLIEKHL